MNIFSENDIRETEKLIRKCGDIILSAQTLSQNDIKEKTSPADLVTVFDVEIQNKLIAGLKEIYPNAHFLAEEKKNNREEAEKGLCFVIDPIDGTANFIHSLKASSISVGALFDGEPVFGAIFDPYKNEYFTAVRGNGAFLNGKRISVSDKAIKESIICFGTSPYKKQSFGASGFALAQKVFMSCADLRRSGSAAIDLCSVACGRTDGFFEPELSPWDYCAGIVIISEAGGSFSDYKGNKIDYVLPSSLVAGNGAVHKKLLDLFNE